MVEKLTLRFVQNPYPTHLRFCQEVIARNVATLHSAPPCLKEVVLEFVCFLPEEHEPSTNGRHLPTHHLDELDWRELDAALAALPQLRAVTAFVDHHDWGQIYPSFLCGSSPRPDETFVKRAAASETGEYTAFSEKALPRVHSRGILRVEVAQWHVQMPMCSVSTAAELGLELLISFPD